MLEQELSTTLWLSWEKGESHEAGWARGKGEQNAGIVDGEERDLSIFG